MMRVEADGELDAVLGPLGCDSLSWLVGDWVMRRADVALGLLMIKFLGLAGVGVVDWGATTAGCARPNICMLDEA
jgi:hypothetical protein